MLSSTAVTVVIADDDGRVLDALNDLLHATDGLEVVAGVGTAEDAVRACETHAPDIAILDVSMPGDGLTAARRIGELTPTTRVVMLTGNHDPTVREEAESIGVAAYLLKSDGTDIVTALRRVTS